jgi:holo-[acyl-carrier protein] synthase
MLGVDIVYLPDFYKKLKNSSLDLIFTDFELSQNKSQESLAGIFAAKEAFFKAVGKKSNWLDVWVEKTNEGKPELRSALDSYKKIDLSISHSKDYAIAVVMINYKL